MISVLLIAACSSPPEKDPAEPFEYSFWFEDDQVGLETELTFRGQVVGHVQKYKESQEPSGGMLKHAYGKVTLPRNWKEDPTAKLSLLSTTPCGPVEVPLELEKEPTATIFLKTPTLENLPSSSVVYNSHTGQVSIGQALLKSSREGWAINGLKCAPEHQITVDGVVVGTMKTPENSDFVFLSEGPEHCYKVTWATYASDHGGSFDKILQGAWAYGMTNKINGFFEEAPDSISMDENSAKIGVSLRYLNKSACPQE